MRLCSTLALVVLLAPSVGCRSKPAPVPPQAPPLRFDDDPDPEGAEPGNAESPELVPQTDASGCKPSGTPWDGKHAGCLYEVDGCCYPDAPSACAAAGCEGGGCQVLESAPAQITCRAD